MAKEIKWSPRATSSFEEICNFISKDSKFYAVVFSRKILSLVKEIPDFPKLGRVVPEYEDENLREKIYQNYRVVYRLKKDAIEIVTIAHGAKILKDIEQLKYYLNPLYDPLRVEEELREIEKKVGTEKFRRSLKNSAIVFAENNVTIVKRLIDLEQNYGIEKMEKAYKIMEEKHAGNPKRNAGYFMNLISELK